jgi:tagatose 6-phosphate kinase
MILAVTLNPAVDITYLVPCLEPGRSHRVDSVRIRTGGKGINVARVLRTLGRDVLVTGLAGAAVRDDLDVPHDLTPVAGDTRRTVTILSTQDGSATTLNEPGSVVTMAEWRGFLAKYRDLATQATVVVLSGSVPPGAPTDAYAQLIRGTKAMTILDSSGDPFLAGLAARPQVVKPNADELTDASGAPTPEHAAAELRAAGAGAVVASLGPAGLLAVTEEGTWRVAPPEELTGNPTGAGDACVAAIAAGLADGLPWPELLHEAVAVSAAAVRAPVAGEIDLPTYEELHAHANR